jgi:hypothetical protein
MVALALNTGYRRGKLLGLKWEHIDFSTARITVPRRKESQAAAAHAAQYSDQSRRLRHPDSPRADGGPADRVRLRAGADGPGAVDPAGLRDRRRPRGPHRLHVPRSPAHDGEPVDPGRGHAPGGQGDPRALGHQADPAVRASESRPTPGRRRPDRFSAPGRETGTESCRTVRWTVR